MGELDYVGVLKSLQQLPFSVGKKLLINFLRGEEKDTIVKHKLYKLPSFGELSGYGEEEVDEIVSRLMLNNLIEQVPLNSNKYWKVLRLTSRGEGEIDKPTLHTKQLNNRYEFKQTMITDLDKKLFSSFDFFLKSYNDEQKKAITSTASRILCVAGAGSGKTTTLTKRIEFLIKYRSVKADRILAITFTRKAREEMQNRLRAAGITGVSVETFNSFCEKILKRHNDLVYDKVMRVLSYRDKMDIMRRALEKEGRTMAQTIDLYYSTAQKRAKTTDVLAHGFMNDCFSVLEYYKSEGREVDEFYLSDGLSIREKASAKLVYSLCEEILSLMKLEGFRDYTDQLLHAIDFFERQDEMIPHYEHVLVDEYQDVNSAQIKLIDLLKWKNIFCVGDPRQSIFGWRGSKISYILDFQKKYQDSEVITLVKNYRSSQNIVELVNTSIKSMKLPALESAVDGNGNVFFVSLSTEIEEYTYVIEQILKSEISKDDIFVLARTNRQLEELSNYMKLRGVAHVVRNEDNMATSQSEHVLLATIHAIKGMEAVCVFVIGCSSQNFPCKAGDHPIVDLVKEVDYDKEEEERRLFYVALSRAKRELHLTTTGNTTRFITSDVERLLAVRDASNGVKIQSTDAFERLREWRRGKAEHLGVPPYIVFHDSVLLDIAMRKPETLDELQLVKGIGPSKIVKYGEEVLNVL